MRISDWSSDVCSSDLTRVPIEKKESIRWLDNVRQSTELLADPGRCIHIGDRESDIYELFCAAREAGTHFVIRTCVDRLAGEGDHTIADEMEEVAVKGLRRIDVRDNNGDPDEAVLEIRYRKIRVLPPIGKQKHYPALISVFCILSWRVFWMTMLNRSAPQAPPTLALTATEIALLDRLVNDKPQARRKTLSHYLIKIARLGGYLARAHDPPPGNTVMWRGLSRLTDIAQIGRAHV